MKSAQRPQMSSPAAGRAGLNAAQRILGCMAAEAAAAASGSVGALPLVSSGWGHWRLQQQPWNQGRHRRQICPAFRYGDRASINTRATQQHQNTPAPPCTSTYRRAALNGAPIIHQLIEEDDWLRKRPRNLRSKQQQRQKLSFQGDPPVRAVKAAVSPGDEAQPKQETKDGSLPQKSEDKDPNRAWETGAVLDGEGVCREGEGSEGAETSGPPSGPRGTPNGLCWAQGHIAWLESRGWQTGDTGSPTRVTESQPDPPGSNENMVNAFLHVYGAPATRKKGNPVSGPAGPEEEGDAGSKGVEEADAANPARGPMERLRFPGVDYAEVEADESLQEVLVVRNRPEAERVAALLTGQFRDYVFACDTEVAFIDVKSESPVGHGKVICFSIYGGTNVNLAEEGRPPKTMLWVDTYGIEDEAEVDGVMDAFRPFFADPNIKKVWHNFSFDRHVLNNHGIDCRGLEADTIHMARMYDASRLQGGGPGYSLEALSSDYQIMHIVGRPRKKTSMKELFEEPVIRKDGTEGKLTVMAPVHDLQIDPSKRAKWIYYSALDARATFELYQALKTHLGRMTCHPNGFQLPSHVTQMWDLYKEYWLPFGQLLTDMEAAGVLVNREHLAGAEVLALRDQDAARNRFKEWATKLIPDAAYMNVSSGSQVRQLFFAGVRNQKTDDMEKLERTFKVPNEDPNYIEEGRKRWKKTRDITLWSVWGRGVASKLTPQHFTPSGWPQTGTPALRTLAGKSMAALKALEELGEVTAVEGTPIDDMDSEEEEECGPAAEAGAEVPAPVSQRELEAEAKAKGYGSLYAAFGGGIPGLRACAAADALVEINAIDTLLSNFIVPLQGDAIATPDKRVHCSLNINTETGRLSARRPNLQNQPALEKDRYKIRKAFTADTDMGKTLIVADYGQLELRLLAHMANCKSMLTAFELGGDFHSRTALGMYDYIQEAVARNEVLLEWDYPNGEPPPVPLIKDKFGSERRKAKVLNFSIAYGKTAHGLAKDFGTDVKEATETVERWYSDRFEVREWQEQQRSWARNHGYVTTLLGRRRILPDINSNHPGAKGRAERAAINTPIQGSAADVAAAAMIAIDCCQELKDLGWVLLLQVHDEVMLEGPQETADRARELVVECMQKPFNGANPLLVELTVDSNIAPTWYEAK